MDKDKDTITLAMAQGHAPVTVEVLGRVGPIVCHAVMRAPARARKRWTFSHAAGLRIGGGPLYAKHAQAILDSLIPHAEALQILDVGPELIQERLLMLKLVRSDVFWYIRDLAIARDPLPFGDWLARA